MEGLGEKTASAESQAFRSVLKLPRAAIDLSFFGAAQESYSISLGKGPATRVLECTQMEEGSVGKGEVQEGWKD